MADNAIVNNIARNNCNAWHIPHQNRQHRAQHYLPYDARADIENNAPNNNNGNV